MSSFYGPTPVQSLRHRQYFWRKLENYSYDPQLADAELLSYYNTRTTPLPAQVNMYDCAFNAAEGWDQHKPRCDRRLVGHVHDDIFEEEKLKTIPVLSSFQFGRPSLPQYDFPDKTYLRRPQISTFYRRFGLNLKMALEQAPA